jgi:TolB protein
MRRFGVPLTIFLVLLLAVFAAWWFGSPRVSAFSPADAALDVQAGSNLRISFSRKMQPDSVTDRLTIEPATPGIFSWDGNTLVFDPLHPWPAGATIKVNLARGGRAAGWLSLPVRQDIAWNFIVRQPRLLYLSPADGAANIYLYDPRTEQSQPVTNLLAGVQEYDATFDGRAVYYSVQNNQGGSDIYRLELKPDLAQSEATQIVACQQAQCRAPRVSPGEEFLAYERSEPLDSNDPNYPRVWIATLADSGAGALALSPDAPPRLAGEPLHQTIQPDWSAQGVLSFYDTNQDVFFVLDVHSGNSSKLPNQTGEPGSWEPNGETYVAPEIFLNTGDSAAANPELDPVASSHLLRFNLIDGTIRDLTRTEELEDASPVFSPDGKLLAFARKYLDVQRWTPGRQLWVMRPDGGEARQLTDEADYNHYDFAWNPDSNQIAFVRFNQTSPIDMPAIWLYNLERGYQIELIKGAYSPHWIP